MTLDELRMPPPDPKSTADWHTKYWARVGLSAVIGVSLALVITVVLIALIGLRSGGETSTAEIAVTGLVSIGSALAGGFAGWFGRSTIDSNRK